MKGPISLKTIKDKAASSSGQAVHCTPRGTQCLYKLEIVLLLRITEKEYRTFFAMLGIAEAR